MAYADHGDMDVHINPKYWNDTFQTEDSAEVVTDDDLKRFTIVTIIPEE